MSSLYNDYNLQIQDSDAARGQIVTTARMSAPIPQDKTDPHLAIRLSGKPETGKFGVLALAQVDEQFTSDGVPEQLDVTAIALTLPAASGTEAGLRIPLQGSIPLKLKLAQTSSEQSQILNVAIGELQTVDIYDVADAAELPTQEQPWTLDLGAISDATSLLQWNAQLNWSMVRQPDNSLNRTATLQTQLSAKFLQDLPTWTFVAANSANPSGDAVFSEFIREADQLKFTVPSVSAILEKALPFSIGGGLTANLLVGLRDGKLGLRLETDVAEKLVVDLGSPLAQLTLRKIGFVLDSAEGLSVAIPDAATVAELALDLFALAAADRKIINNLWSNNALVEGTSEVFDHLIRLTSGNLPALPQIVSWQGSYPTVHKELLSTLSDDTNKLTVNLKRKLQAFTGDLLGSINPGQVSFVKPATGNIGFIRDGLHYQLQVPLTVRVSSATAGSSPIFQATGQFGFWVKANPSDDNYLDIQSGAFVADDKIDITVTETVISNLSDLISLSIPKGSVFRFYTDPRRPQFEWRTEETKKNTPSRIAIRIPTSKSGDLSRTEPERFTFEMEEFALKTGGLDLKGSVRVESVSLGAEDKTGFKQPLAVKAVQQTNRSENGTPQPPKIGEIAFRQSRLIAGSLQASTQLTYFDDAVVTFTLLVSQNAATKELAVVGSVDISGLAEFHVDELFATFQIDVLHLQVAYTNSEWSSRGSTSGRVKFLPPQGRAASDVGELASLFQGVTAEFEELNPVQFGFSELKITFPPKQFEFASIFLIDLRGIQINAGRGGFGLLGDITIQRLPGVDTQLTFGGITLNRGKIPTFEVAMIGASFKVAGGFEIDGALARIKDERETGFGGAVSVRTEALNLSGLVKLTYAKTASGEAVPTLAVYVKSDIDVTLFAGFFLRSLGVGLGVNQALDGLQDKTLPLPKRISQFVNDPKGLPDPKQLAAWVPNPPARSSQPINWMLVATGLITYGNLPRNQEHPLAGGILLAIDQDLDIVAGVNLWLFCTPEQTERTEFIRRPAARGAIAISPREAQVYGMFRTLPNPKLSDNAPKLLGQVLNIVQTSLMFLADRNGFLYEVGWPWETKIQYQLGPLRGELLSGYRFGIYRGVISFGLNYAIRVVLNAKAEIGFNTRFGGAGASLSVYGEGYFRCSFVGALTSNFTPYLLGKVQIKATVEVKVSAYCEFSAKVFGRKITLLKISFSASLKISISAALTAAMEGTDIGFDGVAQVAVSIAGYSLKGSVPLRYQEKKIEQVEKQLTKLLPRQIVPSPSMAFMRSAALEAPGELFWNYHFCWVGRQLRVLLFPRPGQAYPVIEESAGLSRFQITLRQQDKFQGFLGSDRKKADVLQNDTLTWEENLNQVVLSADEIRASRDPDDPIENYQDIRNMTVKDLLESLSESPDNQDRASTQKKEVIDSRTQNPSTANADDETVGIAREGVYSPHFKQDYQAGTYDRKLDDACKLEPSNQPSATEDAENDGLSPELLVAESLSLIKDARAQVSVAAPDYTVAANLNLILVFDAPEGVDPTNLEIDPVEQVLDLSSLRIKGAEMKLRSAVNIDPAKEYDLIPGAYFQSKSEICLTWTFKYEDENLGDSAELLVSQAYQDLDRFVVTRTILQRPTKTSITEVRPAWLRRKAGDDEEWIRPQYQFVDDFSGQEDAPQTGDLVQYVVEARALNDRVLTRCIINVVRQTIEPLQPPSQSLALHRLEFANGDSYQLGKIEIAVSEIDDSAITQQLRLRYRLIPASTVGNYGFEVNPSVQTQWNQSVPGQKDVLNDIDVRFADASQNRPMPWEEVQEYPIQSSQWQTLTLQQPAQPNQPNQPELTLIGYYLEINEDEFWEQVSSPAPGMAVELFVGREDTENIQLRRSPLVRCRHAIQLPVSEAVSNAEESDNTAKTTTNPNYFGSGNTINVIEKLPTVAPEISYLDPSFVQAWAEYEPKPKPSPSEQSQSESQSEQSQPELQVSIQMLWRHDLSCRGGAQPCPIVDPTSQAPLFAPVVGYRIHRIDAYSPVEYVRDDIRETVIAKPELTVRAVPERMYKSQPSTIEVTAKVVDEKTLPDWQIVDIPIDDLWTTTPTPAKAEDLIPVDQQAYAAAPIWLVKPIQDLLNQIQAALNPKQAGHRYVLKFHYPLEDRSPDAVSQEGAELRQRIEKLIQTFDQQTDPFGWWALEALGLSCECHFEDAEGYPVDAKDIIDRLRIHLRSQTVDHQIALAFFLAEDGVTFLNVFRILYCPIPLASATELELRATLLRLQGREDGQFLLDIPDHLSEVDKQLLIDWLKQIKQRLNLNAATPKQVKVYQFNPVSTEEKPELKKDNRAATAQRSLPIDLEEGLLRCRLPVPDQWAHQYAIGLEIIRRYDLIWRHLQAQPAQLETQKIPYSQLKHVLVERSQPLAPHNIVAMPMVGGVQSFVFVHPAAFAATASAVNAVHSQYSGQTVFLQRRIKERQQVLKIYRDREAFGVDWNLYQNWLNTSHDGRQASFEAVAPGPSVLRANDGSWDTLALDPMNGTETGIYAADRYVFPDLPGYYEYQVGVYSTAGRVYSTVSTTSFVTPLYDQPTKPADELTALERPRQQPRTVDCRDIAFDLEQNHLRLKIRLIHARYHLRDEISPLWVDAEELLPVDQEGQNMRYGSLPDLYLTYQIYLRINPDEQFADPVLLPFAEVRPPLGKSARAINGESEIRPRFIAQTQAVGVVMPDAGGNDEMPLPILQALTDRETERLAQGELYFDLTLALQGEASAKMLSDIRAYVLQGVDAAEQRQRSRELIYLAVAREGIWSDIQPL